MKKTHCGKGQILEVQGSRVTVLGKDALDACFGCMNLECKGHRHIFTAENPRGFSLERGCLVEVEVPPSRSAAEAGTALLVPVLAFLAAYFLFPLLFQGPALRIVVSFFALVIAAFGVFLGKKKFPASGLPRIVRVMDAEDT
jgi:positive regulator of sigma E activity